MTIEIPKPHINQREILNCTERFIVVMCGRRFGKSELCQIKLIQEAIQGKQIAYITPTYLLAKKFFFKLTNALPFPKDKSDLIIRFPNGGSVEFFTGERLDNLRGSKFHGVIIDEASYISDLEKGWIESIRPTLTDYKGWAIFISTPKGKNFFYSLFMNEGKPNWKSFRYTTFDNPYIDKEEIEEARKQVPVSVFEQEYLANPQENAGNPFGYEFIKSCTKPLSTLPVKCYGIDLAKSYDFTAIVGLDSNGDVCYFDRFQKDWHSTKQEIMKLARVPIVIDSSGVGDPIFEELQRSGLNIQGFKFSQGSKQQLMVGLQNAIHQNKIGFPVSTITQELEIFEYEYSKTGVKYSAPSGFHDDCVMALALAWHNHTINTGSGKYVFL